MKAICVVLLMGRALLQGPSLRQWRRRGREHCVSLILGRGWLVVGELVVRGLLRADHEVVMLRSSICKFRRLHEWSVPLVVHVGKLGNSTQLEQQEELCNH